VRTWISDTPDWIRVAEVDESELTALDESQLHLGELEALALAHRIHADFLILDEKATRRVAEKHILTVVGTLGVLEKADEEGLLGDFSTVVERLDDTNFYMGRSLKELLLQRHRERNRPEN
jgi:predicted nucleic acid-binding protein